ncbi:Na+-driven multidrug efflux pump [Clostridium saccharobutylicum]|nr:Na+-driven multidrug efflux pump [Clostridium saccharobutylicum]
MIIGAVINIILNPIFIFLFAMGVKGSALATVNRTNFIVYNFSNVF